MIETLRNEANRLDQTQFLHAGDSGKHFRALKDTSYYRKDVVCAKYRS